MVIASHAPIERPRISANQLGEFPFATPAAKLRILRDQKFGNNNSAPYYHSASCAVIRAFDQGFLNRAEIEAEIAKLQGSPPRNDQHAAKLHNNMVMLQHVLTIEERLAPEADEYLKVRRNATIDIEDVTISVRPEIITRNAVTGTFALTKFRFSQSKVSADSSEIILLLVFKYGQRLVFPGFQLDPAETRLIDCYSKTVIPAHTLPRLREQQLQSALREIRQLWPKIRRSGGDFDALPNG